MRYLLDTCVISDFIKGEAGTTARLRQTPPVDIAISAVTVMELRYGLALNPQRAQKAYAQMMKVRFKFSTKPSKQEKATQGKTGLVPAVARWVVERSNAWMECCKSLVKNLERTLFHARPKSIFVLLG
jgi:hypothetical protein